MGYYVRHLSWKKSQPNWKIQYVSHKKSDSINSNAKRPKKEWDITTDRWRSLGFDFSMNFTEAKARAKQLNLIKEQKRQEERLHEIRQKELLFLKRHDCVLPDVFVNEFEKRFIRVRDSETITGKRKKTRAHMIWAAAQKMIIAIQYEPSDWFYYTHEIYDYVHLKQLSIRYIVAILKMANLWGFFICKKMGRPFLQIPSPRGYERYRLAEAYFSKPKKFRAASKALTPENLYGVRNNLNRKNFNWLFISIWLGLRPQEIDNILDASFWREEILSNKKKVLWIFQTKIVALPPEDRWKPIPILNSEQEFAFKIIKSKEFKRPLIKTMRKHFGNEISLYGGRKGFTDLMLSIGHSLENISVWMGHSTLDRTWRSYKDRKIFHINRYSNRS